MILFESLRSLLHQRQCVAFVGAGFSMPCGMPGWPQLVSGLREDAESSLIDETKRPRLREIELAMQHNELALAAYSLRSMLGPAEIDQAVQSRFAAKVFHDAPEQAHRRMLARMENLVCGPWAGIITTNYDSLIEDGITRFTVGAYAQSSPSSESFGAVLSVPTPSSRFFVKLHGSISSGGYVIGTEEYERAYLSNPRVEAFMTAVMLRYHVVFIGCSLEDEILRIRRKLSLHFSGRIPSAYALLSNTAFNLMRREWLEESAQIQSLVYQNPDNSHRVVDEFLLESRAELDPADAGLVARRALPLPGELKEMSIGDKLDRIGFQNRELMQYILNGRRTNTIRHGALLDPRRDESRQCPETILNLSSEERIYRVLFLSELSLVQTAISVEGEQIYRVENDVGDRLAAQASGR